MGPSPAQPVSECRFAPEPASVPRARRFVADSAAALGLDDIMLAELALAVTEAVSNAVMHAYPDDVARGPIVVVIEQTDDSLVVRVRDTGVGMRPRLDSPGLGLGLSLIARFTASMDVREPDDGGTEICLEFSTAA